MVKWLNWKGYKVRVTRGVFNKPRYVIWQGKKFVRIVQDKEQAFEEYLQASFEN